MAWLQLAMQIMSGGSDLQSSLSIKRHLILCDSYSREHKCDKTHRPTDHARITIITIRYAHGSNLTECKIAFDTLA